MAYLIYLWHCFESKPTIKRCYEFRLLLPQQSLDFSMLPWYSQWACGLAALPFVFLPPSRPALFFSPEYDSGLRRTRLPCQPFTQSPIPPFKSSLPMAQHSGETRVSEGGPQAAVVCKAPHGTPSAAQVQPHSPSWSLPRCLRGTRTIRHSDFSSSVFKDPPPRARVLKLGIGVAQSLVGTRILPLTPEFLIQKTWGDESKNLHL